MNEKSLNQNQKVSRIKKELSRDLRKDSTDAENEFWEMVRGKRMFGLKFRRQQIIKGFIVDFYCVKIGLCVEIDGDIHNTQEQITYDRLRDEVISQIGLKILRIRNEDIFNDKDGIIKAIEKLI